MNDETRFIFFGVSSFPTLPGTHSHNPLHPEDQNPFFLELDF